MVKNYKLNLFFRLRDKKVEPMAKKIKNCDSVKYVKKDKMI